MQYNQASDRFIGGENGVNPEETTALPKVHIDIFQYTTQWEANPGLWRWKAT